MEIFILLGKIFLKLIQKKSYKKLLIKIMEKVTIKLIGIDIQKMMNIENKQIIIFIKLNTL